MPKLEDKWNEVIRRAETTDALFCIFKKRGEKIQFFASKESQLTDYFTNTDGFILSSFEDNELKMIPKNISNKSNLLSLFSFSFIKANN